MKFSSIFLAIFIFAVQSAQALDSGVQAPEISLPSLDQSEVKLSAFKGKVVFLDFWASWCGPCSHSLPWLQSMQEKYGEKGLQVVAVNVDSDTESAKTLLKETRVKLLTLLDPEGKTPEQYGVETMPSSFLIGRNGAVALSHRGFSSSDREALEHAIQSLL